MKSKILKLMGVVITVALVCGLAVAFTAAPVAADPDEWTTYDLPDDGSDGDWFREGAVAAVDLEDILAIGPVARDIDGYFWITAQIDADGDGAITAAEQEVLKSLDTEGRSWEITDFSDDAGAAALPVAADVAAIVCSTEDADIVYVAIADPAAAIDAVYKTEDGGDEWEEVSDLSGAAGYAATMEVTCMDVGYVDEEPHIFVGMADTALVAPGEVFYLNDVAFGGAWTDLNVQAPTFGTGAGVSQVYGLAASSDFDNDALVAAVIVTDDGDANWNEVVQDATLAVTNVGADIGTWTDVELPNTTPATYCVTEASDPVFVDDFDIDDAYEFFVAVTGVAHVGTLGGVYRIYGELNAEVDLLDDVDDNLISLDLAGDVGGTYLLAGAQGAADVWYSDDDGDNWEQASAEGIQPTGATNTYVICGDDIADDGIGWAATGVAEGCMSMTMDGGTTWVGISLIDSDIDSIEGLALSPTFASPGLMFVMTDDVTTGNDSILRYDGTNWERVYESTQYAQVIDIIAVSPDIDDDDTVFVGDTGTPTIFFSEDNGTLWEEMREAPTTLNTWAIIDADTMLVGGAGDGTVYYTDIQGRRAWDDYEVEAAAVNITHLVISGDTVIAGNADCDVFISEDLGETWDVVGAQVDATGGLATYVAFDTDDISTIYAATDNTLARFLDTSELEEDWEAWDYQGDEAAFATTAAAQVNFNGIACVDGIVYASDADLMTTDFNNNAVVGDATGGLWRTVNPLEDVDDADESVWDWTIEGLTVTAAIAGTDNFDSLDYTIGSTILWTYDTSLATIWTIEDLLGVVATGGVADPDVDSVTLIWDGFDNATDYDVAVYSDEDMGLAYEWYDAATGDDDPVVNVTDGNTTGINALEPLDAGTEYWWMVRATEPVDSKWSEVWTFTTLPETMTIDADQFGPAIGATEVPITPSFGWQDIDEADEYMFELADNPDFTTPIVSVTITSPVYELDTALDYATAYFWRVKAISGTGESRWATGTFTTMAETVEAPAPPAPAEAPTITIPPTEEVAPNWIYAIIGIGAALAVVVIVLIAKTRKP